MTEKEQFLFEYHDLCFKHQMMFQTCGCKCTIETFKEIMEEGHSHDYCEKQDIKTLTAKHVENDHRKRT